MKSEHRRFAAALPTVAALCLFFFSARAVTLEWDANSETNVAGYRVYMGRQPRVYDSVLDVGNQTLAQLSTIWRTTYFAVTAYDADGLESDFSDEVFYTSLALNSGPVVQADQYSAIKNTTLNVPSTGGILANDSDADGDALTVLLVGSVVHGTLALNPNGSFNYTPALDFTGTDSFSYSAADGRATSAVVTVTIVIDQNPPTFFYCLECFAAFDAVLTARSNVFPGVMAARLNMPTNITCPQAGVLLFGTLCRSLKGIEDAPIRNALASAADCLVVSLQNELMMRLTIASDLPASRWTTAASNQVGVARRNLDRVLATTNETARGQLLNSATASLSRTDRFITSGDLAPAALTDKSMVCKIVGTGPLTFRFANQSFVLSQTNGTPLAVGNYAYTRTAWNSGSLVLAFDSDFLGHSAGEIIPVELKFARPRSRITGSFRGYFQFQ